MGDYSMKGWGRQDEDRISLNYENCNYKRVKKYISKYCKKSYKEYTIRDIKKTI